VLTGKYHTENYRKVQYIYWLSC